MFLPGTRGVKPVFKATNFIIRSDLNLALSGEVLHI